MKGKRYKKKKVNKSKFIISIIQLILIGVICFSGVKIVKWYLNNKENKKILNEVSKNITVCDNKNDKYNVDFESLKQQNPDTIAWIKVENTNIDFPVVKGTDNDYYLRHNFSKEYNVAGWIFADYKNKLDGTDRNIVIYGHNMRDDSMFGTLKNVIKEDWYNNEKNKYVTLITEKENIKYEVFSTYQIEAEEYYVQTNINDSEYDEFIQKVKSRSIKDFGVRVSDTDSILTLSTCANNNKYRIVLHAKKVSE